MVDEVEICRRIGPAVRAFARRRLRGPEADDFAQDVLVAVVAALRAERIEDPTRIGAFALGICRHLAADRVRARERRRELMEQYGPTAFAAETTTSETSDLPHDHLEDCISQLTARSRDVIRATFFDDHADATIADTMSLSAQNVRVIRHRTLAALRECLDRPISWSVR
jgi:RNA polymerase sigma-70 factor (ECF subfamily)